MAWGSTGSINSKLWWLFVVDSLTVSLSRKLVTRSPFFSVVDFLEYWFVHFMGLLLFGIVAAVCVAQFARFWLRGSPEADRHWSQDEALFSVLMTVLVASIFAAFVSGAGSGGDIEDQ
jgi:H+/Cl- antiporter ClcA